MKTSRTLTPRALLCLFIAQILSGCGTSLERKATEQLLISDAVDRTVAKIDFRELAGQKVFFETTHIKSVKGFGFVNADYIVSSLRQQLVAARCLLQDSKENADYILEARIGTLGADKHELVYGIPASNLLSTAAALVPNAPPIPTIPEISMAKRNHQLAAAKIALFAYERETKKPFWQSGLTQARSTANDLWILGAGPFQRGTIYEGTQLAGSELGLPLARRNRLANAQPLVPFNKEYRFVDPAEEETPPENLAEEDGGQTGQEEGDIQQASHSEPAKETPPKK